MDVGRNEGDQGGEVGFDKSCGEGVELASGWLGFPDEFCDFCESEELEGVCGWVKVG